MVRGYTVGMCMYSTCAVPHFILGSLFGIFAATESPKSEAGLGTLACGEFEDCGCDCKEVSWAADL
jgi:hypothetical protein